MFPVSQCKPQVTGLCLPRFLVCWRETNGLFSPESDVLERVTVLGEPCSHVKSGRGAVLPLRGDSGVDLEG